jgi:hypothetical protein
MRPTSVHIHAQIGHECEREQRVKQAPTIICARHPRQWQLIVEHAEYERHDYRTHEFECVSTGCVEEQSDEPRIDRADTSEHVGMTNFRRRNAELLCVLGERLQTGINCAHTCVHVQAHAASTRPPDGVCVRSTPSMPQPSGDRV